jgi:GAF domain-containing protein
VATVNLPFAVGTSSLLPGRRSAQWQSVGAHRPRFERIIAPVTAFEDVLAELLEATRASRVTLRRDVAGESPFPVVAEALAPGVGSLRDERSVHLPTQPVVLEVQAGRQVVQDDAAAAYDDPAFQKMLEAYGGLAAQIVTPVMRDGTLEAIVSVHQLGAPRRWTEGEVAAATRAAERMRELL